MRPLDLLFEAMERGAALARAGREQAVRALDGAEASPLAPLLATQPGKRLAAAVRSKGRTLDVVPTPLSIRDPFQVSPAAPVPTEASRPIGDPSVALLIYGRRTCQWTGRALRLAGDRSFEHVFIDLDAPGLVHLERLLVQKTRHNTSPWVFVRGAFVGGYGSLESIERLGRLEHLLLSEEERAERGEAPGLRFELPAPREDPGAPR